jgi:hypothetical protein
MVVVGGRKEGGGETERKRERKREDTVYIYIYMHIFFVQTPQSINLKYCHVNKMFCLPTE